MKQIFETFIKLIHIKMKKIFFAFIITIIVASCNNKQETKAGVKNDSTILTAPETNSNMTDMHAVFPDSTKPDSNHVKPQAPE